jgi:putative ABC transport system permease protein
MTRRASAEAAETPVSPLRLAPGPDAVLPRCVVAGHVSSPLDDAIFLTARGDRARASLERLTRAHPELEVLTREQYIRQADDSVRQESIAVYVLLGVVVLFAAVAAVNALSTAISERVRELELLWLIGATRRQVSRMVRFEVLLIVAFATTVGLLTAAPGIAVFSYGKTGSLVPAVPLWICGGLPLGAALLAFSAGVIPTRRALRAARGRATASGT